MLSGQEKLKLVRELAGLRLDMSRDISGRDKLKIIRRISEIRVMLGGAKEKSLITAYDVDLNDQQAINAFVESEIQRKGGKLSVADANTAIMLHSGGIASSFSIDKSLAHPFIENGAMLLPGGIDDLLASTTAAASIASQRKAIIKGFWGKPEQREKWNAYVIEASKERDAMYEELQAIYAEWDEKRPHSRYWEDDYKAWEKSKDAAIRPINKRLKAAGKSLEETLKQWQAKEIEGALEEIDRLSEELKKPGQLIIDAVISASPIAEEQAAAYASSQIIGSSAIGALKSIGYAEESLRADIAEFYRISGGKVPPLKIGTAKENGIKERGGRASAVSAGDIKLDSIQIGEGFNKQTLWHEMGHVVEFSDMAAKRASNDFLERRRESEKLYKLQLLDPNRQYEKDEEAYKDAFFDPYVGKHYSDNSTEVMSMGFERLATADLAARLATEDREHLKLILGYASAEMSPLSRLRLRKSSASKAKASDATKEREFLISEIIRLSKRIKLEKSKLYDLGEIDRDISNYFYGDPAFIGRIGIFHIFKGKMKSSKSRRMVNSNLIASIDREGEGFSFGINARIDKDDSMRFMIAAHLHDADADGNSRLLNKVRLNQTVTLGTITTEQMADCYDWLKANYGN